MQSLRHNIYTQLALFSVLYLGAALFVDDNYFRFVLSTVPIWAVMGISWNIFSGLYRAGVFWSRRIFWYRRVHGCHLVPEL